MDFGQIPELRQTPGLRAAVLLRCSTTKEVQEQAIEIQEKEALQACAENGWPVVEIYKELISGTNASKRMEYRRLLMDLQRGRLDVVVVKCQDRIMRSQKDWCDFVNILCDRDVLLYFYMDQKFYNPEKDEFLYGITMQMHAMYSRNLSGKIRLSHRTRQQNKTHTNINLIYGWTKIDKNTFEINEKEAAYIREAYAMLREGKGFYTIANRMYERGARSKRAGQLYRNTRTGQPEYYSDKISASCWRNMLYNPIMYGTNVMNRNSKSFQKKKRIPNPKEEWIYFDNALPPIVSKEYFEETIEMHKNSKSVQNCGLREYNRNMSKNGRYPWTGKMKCAVCGQKYYRRTAGRTARWYCEHKKDCKVIGSIREADLDNSVISELECKIPGLTDLYVLFGKYVYKGIACALETVKETEPDRICLEIQYLEKQREVLMDKLLSGVIADSDYMERNDRLTKQIDEWKQKNKPENRQIEQPDRDKKIETILNGELVRHVLLRNLIKCIDRVTVEKEDGRVFFCTVFFDKGKVSALLEAAVSTIPVIRH